MKIRREHRGGSPLFTIPSYSLHSGEWAVLFLSIHDPFTITVEKGRNAQTELRKCFGKKEIGVKN